MAVIYAEMAPKNFKQVSKPESLDDGADVLKKELKMPLKQQLMP